MKAQRDFGPTVWTLYDGSLAYMFGLYALAELHVVYGLGQTWIAGSSDSGLAMENDRTVEQDQCRFV